MGKIYVGNPHVCTSKPTFLHNCGQCGECTTDWNKVDCEECLNLKWPETEIEKAITKFSIDALKV